MVVKKERESEGERMPTIYPQRNTDTDNEFDLVINIGWRIIAFCSPLEFVLFLFIIRYFLDIFFIIAVLV